jgi:hypothetical protein
MYSHIGFLHLSDRRIKTNIVPIDDGVALSKLRSIEPMRYNYVDFWEKGTEEVMGFIAQDVREVLPSATKITSDYIPNIFGPRQCNGNEIVTATLDITVGDSLRVYARGKQFLVEVIGVNEDSIVIDREFTDSELEDNLIFVYGKLVPDLVTINKDYLFTINFAATQEIDRRQQAQTVQLENLTLENGDLKSRVQNLVSENNYLQGKADDLATENISLRNRVEELESQLSSLITQLVNKGVI